MIALHWYTGILMCGIEKKRQFFSHQESCKGTYLAHSPLYTKNLFALAVFENSVCDKEKICQKVLEHLGMLE